MQLLFAISQPGGKKGQFCTNVFAEDRTDDNCKSFVEGVDIRMMMVNSWADANSLFLVSSWITFGCWAWWFSLEAELNIGLWHHMVRFGHM